MAGIGRQDGRGGEYNVDPGGGQKTPIAPGTFFVSESSNKK